MARRLVLLLGLVAIAVPAWAAEVVEVRVGRHPDFTRVVFELDRAAGYRIERSDPASKTSELIVSLEAGSIPRRIQSSKSFIEQVVVEPSGSRSVARIRLAQSGLKLKEMILASPPRIVLDVISEDTTRTAASRPSPSPSATAARTPAPTPSKAIPSKPATPTAGAAPSRLAASGAKPSNATTPTEAATKPSATTARAGDPLGAGASADARTPVPGRAPAPANRVLATTDGKGAASGGSPTSASTAAPDADALALARNEAPAGADEWNDGSAAGDEEASDAAAHGAGDEAAHAPTTTPAQADAATEKPRERPMMVKTDARDEGPGWMTWALVAAGVAVAGFGALVAVRRRNASAPAESDEGDDASPFFADVDAEHEEETEEDEENPFADLSASGSAFGADAASGREARTPSRAADAHDQKHEKKPSESLLFDDAEETKMEGMEVISRSQTSELGGAMPMMDGGSDEIMQMFREMQRRVAALESRIDELVDARDRLERQVAAQTEELRVQRAAIARTQRAVRNLARNDEGGEDEPTEPALREPN
ncbi:MAG: hypothetical protein R3F35_11595 [Myxococcota bacterium]